MIPLNVQFDAVCAMLLNTTRTGEHCYFFVEFGAREGVNALTIAHSEIHWPTQLVPLAWLVDHKYPAFSLENGNCLIQFIPELESSINAVIASKLDKYCRRKELCECLMDLFGHPLEYDGHLYTSISFLFNMDLAFIVHVTMTESLTSYPTEPPLVQLTSVSAVDTSGGKAVPIRCRLQKFDYELSMPPPEVCANIKGKLLEVQPEFAGICETYMNKPTK